MTRALRTTTLASSLAALAQRHQEAPVTDPDPLPDCEVCGDTGWILEETDTLSRAARCACYRSGAWARLTRDAARYADASLEDLLGEPELHGELADWARLPAGRNLVLIGPVGTGKTHAAFAVARALVDRGEEVLFLPVADAIASLRPGGDEATARRLPSVPVLILDDVGAERSTDWSDAAMFDVVNKRTMAMLPSVITSNLEPNALADALGARLYSRLVGDRAVTLRLSGADRRRQ